MRKRIRSKLQESVLQSYADRNIRLCSPQYYTAGFFRMKMTKHINRILIIFTACMLGFCLVKIVPELHSAAEAGKAEKQIAGLITSRETNRTGTSEEPDPGSSSESGFSEQSWDQLKNENPDFIGYLSFRSGLIEEPVVQSSDDEYYLRRSFFGERSSQGTPFMDSFCSTDSANITIYGHNVYYDSSAMFSRMEELTDPEKFQENALLDFYLKDGQLRTYRAAAVYYSTLENAGSPDYSRPDFSSEEDFYDWINQVYSCAVLSSDVPVRYGDHLLTLQTCRRWDENTHIIVLFREIRRGSY